MYCTLADNFPHDYLATKKSPKASTRKKSWKGFWHGVILMILDKAIRARYSALFRTAKTDN